MNNGFLAVRSSHTSHPGVVPSLLDVSISCIDLQVALKMRLPCVCLQHAHFWKVCIILSGCSLQYLIRGRSVKQYCQNLTVMHRRSCYDVDNTHTHTVRKTRLGVFTVETCVLMWWDTQADNTGPEVLPLCVWSLRQAEAGGLAQTEERGRWGVLCAWLQTRWGPGDLLAGQLWPMTLSQQAPDALLNAFSSNTVWWKG